MLRRRLKLLILMVIVTVGLLSDSGHRPDFVMAASLPPALPLAQIEPVSDRLAHAQETYVAGNYQPALDAFDAIVNDPNATAEEIRVALHWRGRSELGLGDTAAATGAWAGKTNQIAVRIGGVWEYHAPKVGWLCYIEDEAKLTVYKAGGWSAGLAI